MNSVIKQITVVQSWTAALNKVKVCSKYCKERTMFFEMQAETRRCMHEQWNNVALVNCGRPVYWFRWPLPRVHGTGAAYSLLTPDLSAAQIG